MIDAAQISALKEFKSQGKRIVFTNGVFDIIHRGHVQYLAAAKSLGDVLILGLNSDHSVKTLNKGSNRPYNSEMDRKIVLEHLASVDLVFIFNERTPFELISVVSPDILVKGGDYDALELDESHPKYIVGSDIVNLRGGATRVINFVDGFSTTRLVERIQNDGES